MPVPDFQSIMLPFLDLLRDGRERTVRELTSLLAMHFQLSEAEKQELLPSGSQTLIGNRTAWAKTHLKAAGLIENPLRGQVRISPAGQKVLSRKVAALNCRFLKQYPSYLRFVGQGPGQPPADPVILESVTESIRTPQEWIESSFETIDKAVGQELLERLRKCSPAFFEIVVVRLLQALGYGASGDALVTGKSGDGGIDGIIKEDKLGLDIVCVQAKRWKGTVGRPEIQAFVGGMDAYRARKGVVLTTSSFSREAVDYIERIEGKKVVLIDGSRLTSLMIEYDVGVTVARRYELKEVSNDFFDEDEG